MVDYRKAVKLQMKNRGCRDVILISQGILGERILETLDKLQIPISEYISCKVPIEESDISIIEKREVISNKEFIIVALYSGHKQVVDKIVEKGLVYKKDFVATNISVFVEDLDLVDPLLGYSRKEEIYPGIVEFGNDLCDDAYKVLVLGNSTSESSVGGEHCWAYYLQKELSESLKRNVLVYNGGIAGYNSGQEFLKLSRDGLNLKPDMVISLSGINDIEGIGTTVAGKELLHKYQNRMWNNIVQYPGAVPDSLCMRNLKEISTGISSSKKDFDSWIDNERKMYALCKEFKIKFIGALQPMITQGGYIVEEEMNELLVDAGMTDDFYNSQKRFIDGAKKKICQYEYLLDMTELFNGKTEMFFDNFHYNEEGNKIIAKYVADSVIGVEEQ